MSTLVLTVVYLCYARITLIVVRIGRPAPGKSNILGDDTIYCKPSSITSLLIRGDNWNAGTAAGTMYINPSLPYTFLSVGGGFRAFW